MGEGFCWQLEHTRRTKGTYLWATRDLTTTRTHEHITNPRGNQLGKEVTDCFLLP
jgi:hypothetical protein